MKSKKRKMACRYFLEQRKREKERRQEKRKQTKQNISNKDKDNNKNTKKKKRKKKWKKMNICLTLGKLHSQWRWMNQMGWVMVVHILFKPFLKEKKNRLLELFERL